MRAPVLRLICRLLMVCLACLPLQGRAELVGTAAVAASALPPLTLTSLAARADVAAQLRALGVAPGLVEERLSALSEAEAAQLAGRIDSLPAGGEIGAVLLMLIVFLVYKVWYHGVEGGKR